jgi:sulfide dehydrogenase [flavocytochrome c] flavoprotein chain
LLDSVSIEILSDNQVMLRRNFIHSLGTGLLLGASGGQSLAANLGQAQGKPRVIVVGAGFGGLTVAKYIRIISKQKIEVILIDPSASFVSAPLSNLIFSGQKNMAQLTSSRERMCKTYGIQLLQDSVTKIDSDKNKILLQSGNALHFDRLVLSPGISFMFDQFPGLTDKKSGSGIVHAMQAGSQTLQLKKQLDAMPDGGVFAITIPVAPYRCPPAPYERACQVGLYLKKFKPRSKILILDANPEITSKSVLFKRTWATHFPQMIEYRNNHTLMDVNLKENELIFEVQDEIKADVLNIIPPMRAGLIAIENNLANINKRWCGVHFDSYESSVNPRIGDAIQGGDLMPKSAQVAYGQGKACAQAVTQLLLEKHLELKPHYNSLCYSILTENTAAHVGTDHEYSSELQSMAVVKGSQEISNKDSIEDYQKALQWAKDIWQDVLT